MRHFAFTKCRMVIDVLQMLGVTFSYTYYYADLEWV